MRKIIKKFGMVLLVVTFCMSGCQKKDNRSEMEKVADSAYNEAKTVYKKSNQISKQQEDKYDKAYNDVKNVAKSLGDIFK